MSVSIASTQYFSDWINSTDSVFDVRAKSNKSWITATGEVVGAGESRIVGQGTITALRPTIPSITLPATSAGLDNQTARWTVTLHRTNVKNPVFTVLDDFPLNVSFEPATTWAAVAIAKHGKQPLRDTTTYTKIETQNQINIAMGTLNDAAATPGGPKGRVFLSVAPILAAAPIAAGDNDPRIPTQAENNALVGTSGAATSSTNPLVDNSDPRIVGWEPQGTVLAGSIAADDNNVFEPTVIYEGSPQILTGASSVFKMWFTAGWITSNIYYTESVDGIHWVRQSTAILASHYRSYVYKSGATYYLFAANLAQGQIDLYTASVSSGPFTLAEARVIAASGAADELQVANCSVFLEADTWYMLYDQNTASGFTTGLAIAPDATGPWTKQGTVISFAGGTVGGPSKVVKVGSTYYVWMIRTPTATGFLPSDIYRYSATAMAGPWTASAAASLPRSTVDEGVNTAVGQAADPSGPIEVNGRCFMFYAGSSDGSASSGWQHIKLAIANMPISQLVTTDEGLSLSGIGIDRTEQPPYPNSPFVAATYENSWVDYDVAPFVGAGFYKDRTGFVHLRGAVKNGTVGAVRVFRLPVGLRPERTMVFEKPAYQINIYLDGSVEVVTGSNTAVFLDGITFMAYF